jgi:AcrR family transcriptional regulator
MIKKAKQEPTNREQATRARRELLIEAAVSCFVEDGLARTGMRDIAKKAGVSIGNLYNHFPGRDDLIAEIAKIDAEELASVMAEVTDCDDPQKAVDIFVTRYFEHCANLTSAVLTVEITSEALRNPTVARLFSGTRSMLGDVLETAIQNAEHEAFGMAAESRTAIVGLILDMIDGYALRVGLTGKKPSKKDTEALLSVVRCVLSMGGCEKGNHPMLF